MNEQRPSKTIAFETALSPDEAARLLEYRDSKQMSISAVLRQCLRVYDLMERTPGAYEAVNKITRDKLGPKLHPDDQRADEPPDSLWGDGTREILIQLRDWLRSKMPCPAGDCCNELRDWIHKVDQHISFHAPAATQPPPAAPVGAIELLRKVIAEGGGAEEWPEIADYLARASQPPTETRESGWLVENGKNDTQYRYFDEIGLVSWTSDAQKAIRFARRVDAEQFAAADEDAWAIVEHVFVTSETKEPTLVQSVCDRAIHLADVPSGGNSEDMPPGALASQIDMARQSMEQWPQSVKDDETKKCCQDAPEGMHHPRCLTIGSPATRASAETGDGQ